MFALSLVQADSTCKSRPAVKVPANSVAQQCAYSIDVSFSEMPRSLVGSKRRGFDGVGPKTRARHCLTGLQYRRFEAHAPPPARRKSNPALTAVAKVVMTSLLDMSSIVTPPSRDSSTIHYRRNRVGIVGTIVFAATVESLMPAKSPNP